MLHQSHFRKTRTICENRLWFGWRSSLINLGSKKEKSVVERSLLTPAWGFLVTKQRHFSPNAVCALPGVLEMNETLHAPSTEHPCKAGGQQERGGESPSQNKNRNFCPAAKATSFFLKLIWKEIKSGCLSP